MKLSSIPSAIARIWGANASSSYIRTVPDTTSDKNAASWDQGFPANTFVDPSAGGAGPDGRDFNGGLSALSSSIVALRLQGISQFDSTLSSNMNGYPQYAVVADSSGVWWQSQIDNNTSTPGDSSGNWLKYFQVDLGATGWRKNPDGTIEQWGIGKTSGGSVTITFPIAFPNSCWSVIPVEANGAASWSNGSATVVSVASTPANNSVTILSRVFVSGTFATNDTSFFWTARGY